MGKDWLDFTQFDTQMRDPLPIRVKLLDILNSNADSVLTIDNSPLSRYLVWEPAVAVSSHKREQQKAEINRNLLHAEVDGASTKTVTDRHASTFWIATYPALA